MGWLWRIARREAWVGPTVRLRDAARRSTFSAKAGRSVRTCRTRSRGERSRVRRVAVVVPPCRAAKHVRVDQRVEERFTRRAVHAEAALRVCQREGEERLSQK